MGFLQIQSHSVYDCMVHPQRFKEKNKFRCILYIVLILLISIYY